MSTNEIAIKHNKHRIHPCPNDKKLSLLKLLISQNPKAKIIVVSVDKVDTLEELVSDNVVVMSDKELYNSKESTCELLISYNLPTTAIVYMSRLARATDSALILLDAKEQKNLYPIETLLGRVIKQEVIEGFEYEEDQKMKLAQKPADKPKEYEFKKTYEEKPEFDKSKKDGYKSDKKPFDKPKYDKPRRDNDSNDKSKSWDKKKKEANKFLGKDENGKAIFSGKSGDRNHRHDGTPKDRYGAPKKVGKKIQIKGLKPKKDSDLDS